METKNHTDAAVRLAAIMHSSSDAIIGKTLKGIITDWNPAAERLFGYTASEAINQPISIIIPLEKQKESDDTLKKISKGERVSVYETIRKHRNGKWIHVLVTTSPIKTLAGKIIGSCSITHDISDLKLMDERYQRILEPMLKEIYHRVKNNLQVVSSLFNLQAGSIQDLQARDIFIQSATRVKAMALVHEMLYQSSNLAQIEMMQYVTNILKYLKEIYQTESNNVESSIDIDEILLTIDEAIPCGLIINELVSNSFKHAFPMGRHGKLRVSMKKKQNELVLVVQDNGPGLLPHFDFNNTKTLGMQLIQNLTRQLNGTIGWESQEGTTFTLTFPYKNQ